MTAPAVSPPKLRPAHRRAWQLFRNFGPMSHQEAYEVARSEGWHISAAALRSRVRELCPPSGAGLKESNVKRTTEFGREVIVFEVDSAVDTPERYR